MLKECSWEQDSANFHNSSRGAPFARDAKKQAVWTPLEVASWVTRKSSKPNPKGLYKMLESMVPPWVQNRKVRAPSHRTRSYQFLKLEQAVRAVPGFMDGHGDMDGSPLPPPALRHPLYRLYIVTLVWKLSVSLPRTTKHRCSPECRGLGRDGFCGLDGSLAWDGSSRLRVPPSFDEGSAV